MPTTADSYMAEGWYPGKKYTFADRLKQVGSMGIWQPDDRRATAANQDLLQQQRRMAEADAVAERQRGMVRGIRQDNDAADLTKARSEHDLGLELIRDYLHQAYPDKSPEEIARVAATAAATKHMASIEANKAQGMEDANRVDTATQKAQHIKELVDAETQANLIKLGADTQTAENARKRALGAEGNQYNLGELESRAAQRQAELGGETARNGLSYQRQFGDQGGPGAALEADLAAIRQRTAQSNLGADEANFTNNINRATNPDKWQLALSDAQTALNNSRASQALSGARADLVGKNATALSTADLNKAGALPVGYGGTVHVPLPVGGTNVLSGEMRNLPMITEQIKANQYGGMTTNTITKRPLEWAPPAMGTNGPAGRPTTLTAEDLQRLLAK